MLVQLVIYLSLLVAGSPEQEEQLTKEIGISFCRPQVERRLMSGNASFNLIYSLEVDRNGKVVNVNRLRGPKAVESASDCMMQWTFPAAEEPTTVEAVIYWKHGSGWSQQSIQVGEVVFKIRESSPRDYIVRGSDLSAEPEP